MIRHTPCVVYAHIYLQVSVDFIDTHYNHVMATGSPVYKPDTCTRDEKEEIHDSIDRGYDEEYYMTRVVNYRPDARKLLLKKEFHRTFFYRMYRCAETRYTSVTTLADWKRLMQLSPYGLYVHKPSGVHISLEEDPFNCGLSDLDNEDFMLGVMTDQQMKLFLEFCNTVVLEWVNERKEAIDCENPLYSLHITVLDDVGNELPVGFLVTNCLSMSTVHCMFLAMKHRCGRLTTKLLLVNTLACTGEVTLQQLWKKVFEEPDSVLTHVISPWYIKKTFMQLLINANADEELHDQVETVFNEILYGTDFSRLSDLISLMVQLLDQNSVLKSLFNHWSNNLMSEREKWAHCYFPEHIVSINQAINIFNESAIRRLHQFTNRLVGRAVYLIVQYQKNKIKDGKAASSLVPGKKPNAISVAPSLHRTFFQDTKGIKECSAGASAPASVDNLKGVEAVLASRNRRKRVASTQIKNDKPHVSKDTLNRVVLPELPPPNCPIYQEELQQIEEISNYCDLISARLDSVTHEGLQIIMDELKEVCSTYPSIDTDGKTLRPRALGDLYRTIKMQKLYDKSDSHSKVLVPHEGAVNNTANIPRPVNSKASVTLKCSKRRGPITLSTSTSLRRLPNSSPNNLHDHCISSYSNIKNTSENIDNMNISSADTEMKPIIVVEPELQICRALNIKCMNSASESINLLGNYSHSVKSSNEEKLITIDNDFRETCKPAVFAKEETKYRIIDTDYTQDKGNIIKWSQNDHSQLISNNQNLNDQRLVIKEEKCITEDSKLQDMVRIEISAI